MPLDPGTRLGPYIIESLVGAGGMGEVYRARDSRLGRAVALKMLPSEFAADAELRRRLEREARVISSLSHPHVCALFDVGHQDGFDYLVMEYLEGETLAARLTRGALPLDQVLRFASEIAGALAAAHRRGLVHRDLKPGNVMLTRDGARLLDFGLAKPSPILPGGGHVGDLTVTTPISAHGTVAGTYPYMAPEQLEGREADARSDIFAFGAVVYEMATGRRAFDGATAASVIAAILERDPPSLTALQPLAPAGLEDIVRGCLQKDPEERWQTAHDVKLQLEGLRRLAATAARDAIAPSDAGTRRSPRTLLLAALAAAALLGTAAAGVMWYRPEAPASRPVVRAPILPPPGHWFTPNDFQISPDGQRAAFVAAGPDGVSSLWINALASGQSVEIAGTEGASTPFWSADSRWVAFFARGKLRKVDPGGAGVQDICEVALAAGSGAWSPADVIVFSPFVLGPLLQVSANGGTPVPVTQVTPDLPGEAHRFPQFLPDGRRFLYLASWTNQQRGGLYLGSLDGGSPALISSEIRGRAVLAGSQLLYSTGGTLYAQRFDTDLGRLEGDPRPVLRNEVVTDWRFSDLPLSASGNGVLLFQSRLTYNSQLVWYDRAGRELQAVGRPGFGAPVLSPDGRYVAVTHDGRGTGESRTWILDQQRNVSFELPGAGFHTAHAWSTDGRSVIYSATRGMNGIYRRAIDGSGGEETLLESAAPMLVTSASRREPRLLFMDFSRGQPDTRQLDLETGKTEVMADGAEASYSPDGEWIAYLAMPSGPVMRRVAEQGRELITGEPGAQLRWRGDMTELFYIRGDRSLMAVPLTRRGSALEAGTPVPLFRTRIVQPRLVLFQYDVTPDGQRFLINSLPREDAAAPLTVLVNWNETLQ
jgi:Tol biopolymer transport system component